MRYLIIAFAASITGAISGVGGGVIIKPVMDLAGQHGIATINLLSSCTVLAMAVSALIQQAWFHTRFEKTIAIYLGTGAVAGGCAGDVLFGYLIEKISAADVIKGIQNAVLLLLLLFVFVYINKWRERFHFRIQKIPMILMTGIFLGMCSTFLGIGGGPINIAVLSLCFSMNAKEASVNSLILILFSQTSKLVITGVSNGFSGIDLSPLYVMIPAGIAGGIIGSRWNRSMKNSQITRVFNGVLLFVMAVAVFNIVYP